MAGLRPLRGSSWPGAEPRTGWWTRLAKRARSIARYRAAAAGCRTSCWRAGSGVRPAATPMMWKERYTALGGGLSGWGRPVGPSFSVLLGCYLFDAAYDGVAMTLRGRIDGAWLELHGALRFATEAPAAWAC